MRIVPLWGVKEGICTCQEGESCGHPGKHPKLGDNWRDYASNDPDTVERWAKRFPNCNFGGVTGEGIVVLDVDPRNDGTTKGLPKTNAVVRTGGGGWHLYYTAPVGTQGKNVREGVDLRGAGQYVVLPGSLHA